MSVVGGPRAASILERLSRAISDPRPFLVPANICPIVPETLAAAGRRMRFVDIARGDLAMDRQQCLDALREGEGGAAALLFARPYGGESDEEAFFGAVRRAAPDITIIDDKCLCRPDCDGLALSANADVTLFSTGYAKHVDLGGLGFATVAAGSAFDRFNPLPHDEWHHYRSRILAALETADRHKQILNAIYAAGLPANVQLPALFQQWRFNILVPNSEVLVASLFEAGLFASRHYEPVTGRFTAERFPVAEWLHARVVNLFNDRYYSVEQARRTVAVVREHLGLPPT